MNPNLPWIFLLAGWGGAVALVGGVVTYLWLASDSIMEELLRPPANHHPSSPQTPGN